MAEQEIIEALKKKVMDEKNIKKEKLVPVSKEEAMNEVEYIAKKFFMENNPRTPEEQNMMMQNLMNMVYGYLVSVGHPMKPEDLMNYFKDKESMNG